jgi:signal transduction histidine kinase
MSRRAIRVIALTVWVISLVMIVSSVPIGIAAMNRTEPGSIVVIGDRSTPLMADGLEQLQDDLRRGDDLLGASESFNAPFALLLLFIMVWLSVGVMILWRQPRHWAGWLFLITGFAFPVLSFSQSLVIYGIKAEPGSVPLVGAWAFVGEYSLYPVALVPLLFLLYPDGHPPSRRWRWAAIGLVGGTTLAILAFLFRPGPFNNWIEAGILYENPLGVDALAGVSPTLIAVGAIIALVSAFSTVFAVRQRFKRSLGEERQQMRWIAYVASLAGALFALWFLTSLAAELFLPPNGDASVFDIFLGLTALTIALGIPAAYLIAIFRYGLWELDVVIKKTVQYGLLVAVFTGLVGLVLFLASRFIVGTGGTLEIGPTLFVAVVLAVGFNLLRSRARRWANRIVYGKRSSPYEVLSEFSDRVGGSYSVDDVLPRMAQLLGEATGAKATRVWLRHGDELRAEVAWPADAPAVPARSITGDELPDLGEDAYEVRHQAELLGALTISPAPNDPMTPTKEQLARDMAAQAGLVLRNVALIADVRESRRRIVTAQDERARKLERDIHDGAQQQLVALSVKLRLAEQLVDRDPPKAQEMLAELQTQTTETLEDLRDLARGIYPPLLADQGLATALESQARRSSVAVAVHPDGVGRYRQDVESAVYFCCLEALNNVAKYADASHVDIRLASSDGELRFEVTDDGRGFDRSITSYGTGLQGMSDRLDAIGGSIDVESAPGRGTTIIGRLPIDGSER